MIRRRWPGAHRRMGYGLFGLAVLTGAGGLVYILSVGTIGGLWMSFWFSVYGLSLVWAAASTVYFAIEKDMDSGIRFTVFELNELKALNINTHYITIHMKIQE